MECPFCNFLGDSLAKVIIENKHCLFMQYYDGIPEGSGLIIPKAHRETVFNLTAIEWEATYNLLNEAKMLIDQQLHPDGYNIGWNVGKVGGQEVFHAHLHIVPRYSDELYSGKGIRYWLKKPENKRKRIE
jgi:diadenosine tetraphosphate (Ap4A) HIT family hydrolase